MTSEIKSFMDYLRDVRKASRNIGILYQRDLMQLAVYLENKGVTEVAKAARTSLNSYILFLEKGSKATMIISKELASIKALFSYLFREDMIRRDPAELLRVPKIKKKAPVILNISEVDALLEQPGTASAKEIRNKTMLELSCATRIRVPKLIGLGLEDLNIQVDYIVCRDGQKERIMPLGKNIKQVMTVYLGQERKELLKGSESEWLFTSCSRKVMSRQGFWKVIRYYGEKAKIKADVTPHTLHHSFAAHLIRGGADIRTVQAMLGHSDPITAQMYATYPGSTVGETYRAALRRKRQKGGDIREMVSEKGRFPWGSLFYLRSGGVIPYICRDFNARQQECTGLRMEVQKRGKEWDMTMYPGRVGVPPRCFTALLPQKKDQENCQE